MKLFGLTIHRTPRAKDLSSLSTLPAIRSGGWFPLVREFFAGAWQRNVTATTESVVSYFAVYACVTLIASDIGKLRIKLMQEDDDGIGTEIDSAAYSPVLRKPNHYQITIKFLEQWVMSKLLAGNTYVLKERDNRGVVVALYVLDAQRVKTLVAPDGSVFYDLCADDLAGVGKDIRVPASEIIHDVMVPLYHPLCGVTPITACGLSAIQGLRIQSNSASFFGNNSQPGGILSGPAFIEEETAKRIKEHWETEFSGANAGRVAVLGDGLKYEAMSVSPVDAQLIEQLKWSAENVCSCFHVPAYMIGVGPPPSYSNIEALNLQYYSQALQNPIESIEALLDEGIGLPVKKYTELDLDNLLRMDTPTRVKAAADAIGSAAMSPDEARRRFLGLGKVPGGNTPYMQEQNWPLRLLNARELPERPPTKPTPIPGDDDMDEDQIEAHVAAQLRKELDLAHV